ncbi:ATP-grasp domain-containing protein [Kitasatospora sp. NPDC101176]|uniref:ATP-grasp domain-containing protein n=1 Tax=Kitasatospora sp. NPDC101176 TaxID=3364099 RepID=UPI003830785C
MTTSTAPAPRAAHPVPSDRPVVIVDGYSNASALVSAFAAAGHPAVHVLSTAEPRPAMIPPRAEDYRESLVCPDASAFEATVARLAALAPVAVVAGQEPGVPLADALAERLGLPGNGTALSAARRDKFRMIEALRAAGIRCAEQFKADTAEAVVGWARARADYPVVVKPLSSASSDNVYICHDEAEVESAAHRVLAGTSMFAERNTEVLVQSFLPGTEYCVDSVSADGHSFVAAVWEYEKNVVDGGRKIYDRDVLRDPDAEPVPALVAYVRRVLDALGIRHGASHAEVIMTPQGPALVEVGARFNGAMQPDFYDHVLGTNPAALVARALLEPEDFARRFGGRVYRPRLAAAVYESPTALDGVVDSVDESVVDRIAALPTVHSVVVRSAPGRRIRPTVDLLSSPLRLFMAGADQEELRRDREVVDTLKDRVYRLR